MHQLAEKPTIIGKTTFKRRLGTFAFRSAGYFSAAFALLFLVLMFVQVVQGAIPAMHWSVFVKPIQGTSGGLANAITGTLWLSLLTLVLVVPIGVSTATWMVVYASPRIRNLLLLISDILSGVPSIVFGYVGYLAFVISFGWGFSALAAAVTLFMLVLPYVVRNSYQAMLKVPNEQVDAAFALGFSTMRTVISVWWPQAFSGIVTGIVLALGVAMGETAPLLYTAEWSQNMPSLALTHHAVGYLTYVVWEFVQLPYPQSIALAYMAGLLLMIVVGLIALVARVRLIRG